MPNTNLGDVVTMTQDEGYITLKVMKVGQPVKPFALKEVGKHPDGTAIYEVPKSTIWAYFARDLADGSVLTVMRRKEVPYAKRLELYEAATKAGMDVRPVEEPAKKAKRQALTLEELKQVGFATKPNGKHDTVTNSL